MIFNENVKKFLQSIEHESLNDLFLADAEIAFYNNDYKTQREIAINLLATVFNVDYLNDDFDVIIEAVDTYISDYDDINLFDIYANLNDDIDLFDTIKK